MGYVLIQFSWLVPQVVDVSWHTANSLQQQNPIAAVQVSASHTRVVSRDARCWAKRGLYRSGSVAEATGPGTQLLGGGLGRLTEASCAACGVTGDVVLAVGDLVQAWLGAGWGGCSGKNEEMRWERQ